MKKYLLYIACGAMALVSCDALNQTPTTSVTTDTAITSVGDLGNAVNGVYYVATYGTMLTMGSELAVYADLCGPDSSMPSSSGQNASRIQQYSLTPADTYNVYYYLYAALASVNQAIVQGGALEDTEGAAPYIAELYGLRGLLQFHLATFFAPIPTSGSSNTMGIVLSDQVFPIDYVGPRASLDDTYQQIVDDLSEAVDSGLNKEKNTGHLNYWAALALRARAYLYWGKYDEALEDCKEVIESSPYDLYTTGNYVASWSQEGADEVILEYIQTDNYNAQRYAPGYYTSPDGYAEYGVTEAFYNWMKEDENDVRNNMVGHLTGTPGTSDIEGYFPLKYPGKSGAAVPMYTNNIRIMRLSEVYLIAAEAALKGTGGSGDAAAGYINDLRRNRITGYADVQSVDIDDIIDERRKELFAEGHIAFDYWRNGKAVVKGATTIAATDNKTVLPLPTEEMQLSNGVLIQNPGYGN